MNAFFYSVLFLTESTCTVFFADVLQHESWSHAFDKHKLSFGVVPEAAAGFNHEPWRSSSAQIWETHLWQSFA